MIEDAAQALLSTWHGRAAGTIGHLSCFSFHETKSVISGEGGALAVNDPGLIARAEIIREKGTNRSQFFRGQVDKYTWVDVGSSFLPSELVGAYLAAQLEPSAIAVYSDTEYSTADAILRAAAMTVPDNNSPLLFFGAVYNTSSIAISSNPSNPTTWTQDDTGWNTTSDWFWHVLSLVWTGSGTTGTIDATIDASDANKHAFAVALRPKTLSINVSDGLTLGDDCTLTRSTLNKSINVSDSITIGTSTALGFKFRTDFSEYTTGVQPSDWTERWNADNAASTVETGSGLGGKQLQIAHATDGRYMISWDALG